MSIDMQQFHGVFFEETQEHIYALERILLAMDPEELDQEDINCIFRAAHSIKGGSAIFGFDGLTGLTHVMESLLVHVRNQQLQLTPPLISTLLNSIDVLQLVLVAYQNDSPLPQLQIDQQTTLLEANLPQQSSSNHEMNDSETIDGFGFFDSSATDNESFGFFTPLPPIADTHGATKPLSDPEQQPSSDAIEAIKLPAVTSIRVDTNKIDSLVNLVGELVIADAMLQQMSQCEVSTSQSMQHALEQVTHHIRLMQDAVMNIRMLPLSFVFNRFPRVVHDMAKQLDKQVELVIQGSDTEIDKGMIEQIVDPLTHLIRNSLDHGIESASVRQQQSKPRVATITLSAYQKGNNIHIDVSDDGAGLPTQKILEKAYANGLVNTMDLTDEQIWPLIMAPGLSTAHLITDVSGRGVGMDVVKQNIEQLNGHINIHSTSGVGTTFSLSLPLTMAIVESMKVRCDDQIYIIPLSNIIESFRPNAEQMPSIANQQIIHIRGEYLPLIALRDLMAPHSPKPNPTQSIIMIIESGIRKFCLHVDSLDGQQQVVIKSLEKNYKAVTGVSGATIMGDGSVALILDVEQLAQHTPQQLTSTTNEVLHG